MVRRGQLVTAVAAVLSPLVFAVAVPALFHGGPSGRVARPKVPPQQLALRVDSPRGARLWVDPDSQAARAVSRTFSVSSTDAGALRKIASRPLSTWLTDWLTPTRARTYVAERAQAAESSGTVPVFVVYGMPVRGCGASTTSGLSSPAAYRTWVDGIAGGLSGHRAIVVVEPDSLPSLDCLDADKKTARTAALAYAVDTLRAQGVAVYLDAGHARWQRSDVMASRLRAAGVLRARGFSLNVSNFDTTDAEITYGRQVSLALGGAVPFVVDTSRNGNGPWDGVQRWCNPPGRALGRPPTTSFPDPLVDALLWIKTPGLSDGTCRGGPPAGQWWQSYALDLARNADW